MEGGRSLNCWQLGPKFEEWKVAGRWGCASHSFFIPTAHSMLKLLLTPHTQVKHHIKDADLPR